MRWTPGGRSDDIEDDRGQSGSGGGGFNFGGIHLGSCGSLKGARDQQKILPAKQIVKFAPWMIERSHLDLPSVRKEIRRVYEGRRMGWAARKTNGAIRGFP